MCVDMNWKHAGKISRKYT